MKSLAPQEVLHTSVRLEAPQRLAHGDLAGVFAPEGRLSQAFPGFEPRQSQLEMAQKVEAALHSRHVLIAEAGTGTGKTYAYLAPVLLSGLKTVISTGTKTLQDQLFNRDLPSLSAALGHAPQTALLKGRASYLCPYHLDRHLKEGRVSSNREIQPALVKLRHFSRQTATGDRAECTDLPEDSPAWAFAVSTRENCLGASCPDIKGCFLAKARRAAMDADIVVINHHLFFADAQAREEGLSELLPDCEAVVFDEAHLLPEIATQFLGQSLALKAVFDWVSQLEAEPILKAGDARHVMLKVQALETAARGLRETLGIDMKGRLSQEEALKNPAFEPALAVFAQALKALFDSLEGQAGRSEALLEAQLGLATLLEVLTLWVEGQNDKASVCWMEVFAQTLTLHVSPLDVGPFFRAWVDEGDRAWVLTSATLAVRNDFAHYRHELGLTNLEKPVHTGLWESPFDYENHALLYAPKGMPDPNHPQFAEAVGQLSFRLIQASQGRAFVLCTSLRAMRQIHAFLEKALFEAGLDYALLLQSALPKNQLLERFRTEPHPVLVASQSFWEGVDVQGQALSLVIIDRLPFSPPDDPVLSARMALLRESGGNPFMDQQLPQAVISLKQGAGRLIRSGKDKGLLCIADPRLVEKPYGRLIWQSLPPMKRTREEAQAVQFLGALPLA
jgi:ATP-dependent DNA helicase DinG